MQIIFQHHSILSLQRKSKVLVLLCSLDVYDDALSMPAVSDFYLMSYVYV